MSFNHSRYNSSSYYVPIVQVANSANYKNNQFGGAPALNSALSSMETHTKEALTNLGEAVSQLGNEARKRNDQGGLDAIKEIRDDINRVNIPHFMSFVDPNYLDVPPPENITQSNYPYITPNEATPQYLDVAPNKATPQYLDVAPYDKTALRAKLEAELEAEFKKGEEAIEKIKKIDAKIKRLDKKVTFGPVEIKLISARKDLDEATKELEKAKVIIKKGLLPLPLTPRTPRTTLSKYFVPMARVHLK
jgi:hypothetical protein